MKFRRAFVVAIGVFLAMFCLRLTYQLYAAGNETSPSETQSYASSGKFEIGRKNYASVKNIIFDTAPPVSGDSQKYEKIATLSQKTSNFEEDRKKIADLIATAKAITQFEKNSGLKNQRVLHLGIGVPPDNFDGFIEQLKTIGELRGLEIIKNDKTNEFLTLRAKRATLEKIRGELQQILTQDIQTSDRLNVIARLAETERDIQALGVSLGEFDQQNEFCTVKLTLNENPRIIKSSTSKRTLRQAVSALSWTAQYYAIIGIAIFCLSLGLCLCAVALQYVFRLMNNLGPK